MKTNYVRHTSLVLAAGLVLVLGCARPAAETEQPRTVVAPTPAPIVLAQAAPVTPAPAPAPALAPAPNVAPDSDAPDTNGPAIIQRIPPTANPASVTMTPGLSEVVKLAQAGVGEEVILTYVEKYPNAFNVGADQILYLNDLGVSSTVITSMLKHDGSNVAATAPAASSVIQTQPVSNVPMNQVYPATSAPAPQVETTVAPPPTTEVSYFYDSLSPYGSWIYLSGYGWCWQPTVAVRVSGWRPYSDRGRWYWSDAGWYWNSDYSWGWAAFHYGRWYYHGRCGWVWTPGTVWGPSWVSWRYTDGYCGWAPLPPEAHYRHGVGFTYYGRGVSVGFDFGLTAFHYSFVSYNRFCDYSPYRYYEPRHRNRDIYRNTTVINNYVVGNNNTIINRGVGRETVAARAGANNIREVTVRERSARELTGVRAGVQADQIERRGRENVVYRPELPKTPPPVRTASFGTRATGQGQSTVARRNENGTVPSGNNPITINRSTVSGGVVGGSPATTVTPARTPRGTETSRGSEPQRGQTAVTRNNNNSGNTAVTPRSTPNANTPAAPSRGQSESRTGRSLFGDSGANTQTPAPQRSASPARSGAAPAQNAAPQRGTVSRGTEANVAGSTPRSQPQQNYSAPTTRAYPQTSTPSRAPQTQQSYGRVETRQPANSSPRGYEQAPRSAPPSYSAPAPSAPRNSAPSGGSPSGGRNSSGGGNSGGSRGVERGR
jgi:hypothetical protein